MNFVKKPTPIPGCFEIIPTIRRDSRGLFIKIYNSEEFAGLGLDADFKEAYYSVSKKGVLRGMHFQTPPAAISKLVYCVEGEIIDAVLDLRKKSATYGKSFTLRLNAAKANMLFIPKGCAHGFYTVSRRVVMLYHVSGGYSPKHDAGILWSSAGIKWPCRKPVISERDGGLPEFGSFRSMF